MFDAMLNGRIDTEGLEFEVVFKDIEELNAGLSAAEGVRPHISKASYAVLPQVAGRYCALRSGSALGRGNGPLLVAGDESAATDDCSMRIAVPGMHTTANLLMERLFPHLSDKRAYLFSDIPHIVGRGECDAGVLIHEGRFVYRRYGLFLLAGLIGLAVAGVVFLVCKVFSYYRKKRHPEAPVVSFFSSEGGILIASPLEGKLLPLDGIEDPVFSAEVLGKGCAIEPDKGEIYAPADGVILKIAESSHAVSLRCDSGVDLLIHVGMDTVERHGAGFAPQVRAGEHVQSGQLLLKFDLQKIRADGYPLTTPVVVTNSDAFSDVTVVASGNVTEGQNILLLR